jgi:hypothetical protein
MFIVLRNQNTPCGKNAQLLCVKMDGTYIKHLALKDNKTQLCVAVGRL